MALKPRADTPRKVTCFPFDIKDLRGTDLALSETCSNTHLEKTKERRKAKKKINSINWVTKGLQQGTRNGHSNSGNNVFRGIEAQKL